MTNTLPFLTTSLLLVSAVLVPRVPGQDEKPKQDKPAAGSGVLSEEEFAKLHELRQGAAPKLLGTDLQVGGAKAYLALPATGKPKAAVLVIHEWWGLNSHIKHWTDRLAADGYAALAIDLYNGVVATTPEAASKTMQSVDPEQALRTLKAAHEFLAKDPRVKAKKRACIGWCFGGAWSLQHAIATPDLDAAVVYYGRLVTDPAQLASIRAPMLGVFGNQDKGIPPASVDAFEKAMKQAGKSLELRRYDANHAFANPSSARYDKANAAKAWAEVQTFLARHLGEELVSGSVRLADGELSFTVPKSWKRGGIKPMRLVTFTVGEAECYVTKLRGTGGGVSANLNRWRQQMGQAALSSGEIAALPKFKMLGQEAVMIRIDGEFTAMSGKSIADAVMFGVVCALPEETVFVKMIGPKSDMRSQAGNFEQFCRSLK